mmetsp:Transcript_43107/g.125468  ORF Transcript_43107/g.125468 Transcript_43107/m.125468 type:complete len:271 (+) Transcript_43107:875-1687(+)
MREVRAYAVAVDPRCRLTAGDAHSARHLRKASAPRGVTAGATAGTAACIVRGPETARNPPQGPPWPTPCFLRPPPPRPWRGRPLIAPNAQLHPRRPTNRPPLPSHAARATASGVAAEMGSWKSIEHLRDARIWRRDRRRHRGPRMRPPAARRTSGNGQMLARLHPRRKWCCEVVPADGCRRMNPRHVPWRRRQHWRVLSHLPGMATRRRPPHRPPGTIGLKSVLGPRRRRLRRHLLRWPQPARDSLNKPPTGSPVARSSRDHLQWSSWRR